MAIGDVLTTYFLALFVFLVLDLLWLGILARHFYMKHLEKLFADKVKWPAAGLFYLLFMAGMMIFAVHPAVAQGSFSAALVRGALYGLCTYATYDLTNLATLREWPIPIVVVDIFWGMGLSATVSVIGFWAATQMG
ncbi:MAG: DUF2177 family protein [Desulfobacterales bacterium]|jgi:uncharacterized membrane protein|nr:DUF2177 family protein [Desulfobacterales bacterium]